MKVLLYILISVAALLSAVSFGLFIYACYRRCTLNKGMSSGIREQIAEKVASGEAWFFEKDPESVYITSHDGLKLHAYYLKNGDSDRTIILMHGYRAPKGGISDFGLVIEYYHSLGLNLLLVDQRAHGKSEGSFITFGIRERFDCERWVRYICERSGGKHKILLDGISMGASTVLMACGSELPYNVRGVIADCGFTSPYEQLCHVAHSMKLPSFPFVPLVGFWTRVVAGFSLKGYSTVCAVKANDRLPVLFIHGAQDSFVPVSMSRENHKNCSASSKLIIVDGAAHGLSYLVATAMCQSELRRFVDETLGGAGAANENT